VKQNGGINHLRQLLVPVQLLHCIYSNYDILFFFGNKETLLASASIDAYLATDDHRIIQWV
jgi:hypothetical protein